METQTVNDIIACLPKERTLFHYFKDRYAVYLLQRSLEKNALQSVQELKQTQYSRLLEKPVIKDFMGQLGKKKIAANDFNYFSEQERSQFVLTLGRWGRESTYTWNQTSRPGSNLVLHLNLPDFSNARFLKITGSSMNDMARGCHPHSDSRRATLAWARLDVDFSTGEVLIEEIQSDLIRDLELLMNRAKRAKGRSSVYYPRIGRIENPEAVEKLCAQLLQHYQKYWFEVMLTAALWFIHCELGCSKVYYHTYETGNTLKRLKSSKPPRSLYTDLPEKFCFQKTKEAPSFITRNSQAVRRLKKIKQPEWFLLSA